MASFVDVGVLRTVRWGGLALIGVRTVAGCSGGGGSPDDDVTASASTTTSAGTDCRPGRQGAGCYDLARIASAYCWVQEARTLVRQGRLDVGDLPAWTDRSDVDGAPRIVDFPRGPKDRSSAQASDEIRRFLVVDGDFDIPQSDIGRCADDLTQEQVERTEGGPAQY